MDGITFLLDLFVILLVIITATLPAWFVWHGPGVTYLDRVMKVWFALLVGVIALSSLAKFVRMEE